MEENELAPMILILLQFCMYRICMKPLGIFLILELLLHSSFGYIRDYSSPKRLSRTIFFDLSHIPVSMKGFK
jgi:hypothetical protein